MKSITHLFTRLTAVVACALALTAASANAEHKGTPGQFSKQDFKFVTETVEMGQTEVQLGQLAVEKATATEVRQFGEKMVADHKKAGEELKQLMAQKGAVLQDKEDKKQEKIKEDLMKQTGADFDKAFMKAMVSDHKKCVKAFEKQAEKADDADLRTWAAKTLPTLKEHLRMAEDLERKVRGEKLQTKAD